MSWKQLAWIIISIIPGGLPGILGVLVIMDYPHVALPEITGWMMITQTILFIWLCTDKYVLPNITDKNKIITLEKALKPLAQHAINNECLLASDTTVVPVPMGDLRRAEKAIRDNQIRSARNGDKSDE